MSKIKFRKRYLVYVLIISYLIICQSCMKMRMNSKKAKAFFETTNTDFIDKTVILGEYKIHYLQTGDNQNPTLFFVHGSPGSWDAYKEYLKDTLLLQKYRMIAIDRPGFGYSNFSNAEDLQTQAERITLFLKSIDNKKPITLIGHSMGGQLLPKWQLLNQNYMQTS